MLCSLALALGLGVGLTHAEVLQGLTSSSSSSSQSTNYVTTANGSVIWQPPVGSTYQIVLDKPVKISDSATSTSPNVDIFEIDMFGNTQTTITKLHNLGKKVICYFSAGSYEPYRPDSNQFWPSDLGNGMVGWPDEKWIDINSGNVRSIMAARIKMAASKGCDAVDPDNMDGYDTTTGFNLTQQEAINYMDYLSCQAASYNMSIGLKNAGEIIQGVMPVVQFSIAESCVKYSECTTYDPFINAGKPVFSIQYPAGAPNILAVTLSNTCATTGPGTGSANFSTVLKKQNLDGWVEYCDGSTGNTPLGEGIAKIG